MGRETGNCVERERGRIFEFERRRRSYYTGLPSILVMSAMQNDRQVLPRFIIALLGLSIPFWVLGAIYDLELFPGFKLFQLPLGLPAVAALLLFYKDRGVSGVTMLLRRTYDIRKISSPIWFIPILLVYPSIGLINYSILLLSGSDAPPLHTSLTVLLGYSTVFFMTYGEELGLTGYLIDPLQRRMSAFCAGILVGIVWAGYHIPGFIISGYYSAQWIFWHAIYTVAGRVLFVWVYNNSGKSLFSMALFHATFGLFWILLPATGNLQKASPHYDPMICALAALVYMSLVVWLWGPKTLAQFRFKPVRSDYGGGAGGM
jgi:membrane protease YdiL (CAAX protease family)